MDDPSDPHIVGTEKSCTDGTTTFNGHPYSTTRESDVVFWDWYSWTLDVLRQNAAHEMGHGLGLNHSSENPSESDTTLNSAIMYYRGNGVRYPNSDDIAGIQFIYGVRPNSPPTANAGPDQSRGIGDAVALNGTASSDPDRDPLDYFWRQTGGPTVTLNNANTAYPNFTLPLCFDSGTAFTFALRVGDGRGLFSTDDFVDIRISDSDPDRDGLNNSEECAAMADPRRSDTDGDGIRDGDEAHGAFMCRTNPASRDTDGDTLSDGDEINRYHTNPCNRNTDGDCDDDNVEIGMTGRNPTVREMAEIQVTPNMLIFNDVNRRGKLRNVEVRNTGNLPLQISRFATEGMGFSASSMPVTLAVGAMQPLQVLFSPQVAGPVTGSLQFESNDCQHNPFTVSMAANGQVSRLSVTEENLDFAHVPIRTLARQVIHLNNPDSNRALKVTLITEDPAFYPARPIQQIAPGATVEMAIYFKPYRYGNFESKVKIRGFYAQENQLREVTLRGFGEGDAPVMASTPERIDFPETAVGVQDFREIRIRNSGRAVLYIHRVEVVGADGNPLDAELPIDRRRILPMLERFTVAGLGERTMRVRFQATVSGELRGELRFHHNAGGTGVFNIPFVARGR